MATISGIAESIATMVSKKRIRLLFLVSRYLVIFLLNLLNPFLFSIYVANLFSKRDIQSLLSLFSLNVSIRLFAYPYNNRIRMLLAAAGNTVPNDMAIGPAPWSKRIPISVYVIGMITGGNIGEITTRHDMTMCFNNIFSAKC